MAPPPEFAIAAMSFTISVEIRAERAKCNAARLTSSCESALEDVHHTMRAREPGAGRRGPMIRRSRLPVPHSPLPNYRADSLIGGYILE